MEYRVNHDKNIESFTIRSDTCEFCRDGGDRLHCVVFDKSHNVIKTCEHYGSNKVIWSGTIGESFLDFVSLDFSAILKKLYLIFKDWHSSLIDIDIVNDLTGTLKTEHLYFGVMGNFFKILCLHCIQEEPETAQSLFNSYFDDFISYKKIITEYTFNDEFKDKPFLMNALITTGLVPPNDVMHFEPSKTVLPPNSSKDILDFIYCYRPISNEAEEDVYNFDEIKEICGVSLRRIILEKPLIKKCNNCGKFFIPSSRSDEIYCSRISPQDSTRTCKEYGSQKLWYEKIKQDETAKLCRNIYMAKQMLVKRNPDILEYQTSFENFKRLSKQWKADVKTGAKTDAEFLEWLKAVKEKRLLLDGEHKEA